MLNVYFRLFTKREIAQIKRLAFNHIIGAVTNIKIFQPDVFIANPGNNVLSYIANLSNRAFSYSTV